MEAVDSVEVTGNNVKWFEAEFLKCEIEARIEKEKTNPDIDLEEFAEWIGQKCALFYFMLADVADEKKIEDQYVNPILEKLDYFNDLEEEVQ